MRRSGAAYRGGIGDRTDSTGPRNRSERRLRGVRRAAHFPLLAHQHTTAPSPGAVARAPRHFEAQARPPGREIGGESAEDEAAGMFTRFYSSLSRQTSWAADKFGCVSAEDEAAGVLEMKL